MGNKETASLLADKGAEVDGPESDGWTPVMTSTIAGNAEMARLLLNRGAKPNLAVAAMIGDCPELDRALEARKDCFEPMADGPLALIIAARGGQEAMVKSIVEKCSDVKLGESCGRTALLFAIENHNAETVGTLLNKGASANAADSVGATALQYAVQVGDTKIVQMLLDKGADPDVAGWWGRTPLWMAVEKGNVEMAKALLEKGAEARGDMGYRSLMGTAHHSKNKEMVDLLREYALKEAD
jgi:ankyrin repeat protein